MPPSSAIALRTQIWFEHSSANMGRALPCRTRSELRSKSIGGKPSRCWEPPGYHRPPVKRTFSALGFRRDRDRRNGRAATAHTPPHSRDACRVLNSLPLRSTIETIGRPSFKSGVTLIARNPGDWPRAFSTATFNAVFAIAALCDFASARSSPSVIGSDSVILPVA